MIVQAVNTVRIQQTSNPARAAVSDAPAQHREVEQKAKPEIKISQAVLDGVQHEIQKMSNVGLQFSVHESTGRTIVKVVDKETGALIREIPAKELLNLAAKIEEMMGILFDKRV